MKERFFHRLSLGVAAAFMLGAWAGTAEAVSSLSKPGEEIEKAQPQADASVKADLPEIPSESQEVRFTVSNVRLDAQELKLNKEVLARILSQSVGVETTLSAFNQTVDKVTAYCRSNGYPASAAFLPAQESTDGTVTIKVIPGRYGEVRIENNSRLSERVIRGFLHGLKQGDIIRTAALETALYSISDISGAKAIGVLSPGKDFGTSDLTVRVEDGKRSNTVLYAENYGSKNSGEYRFGVQESLYNLGGTGARMNLGEDNNQNRMARQVQFMNAWLDTARAKIRQDAQFAMTAKRFPVNTPATKEEYYYRSIFAEFFPSESAAACVPHEASVACSTAKALEWDAAFRNMNEPSGRAVAGVHQG